MRDIPLYTLSEVDRLVGVMPGTASRWLRRSRTDGVSFEELIEVLIVSVFRKQGLSYRDIRSMNAECEKTLRIPCPFTSWAFRTCGAQVLMEIKRDFPWKNALEPIFVHLDYDEGRVSAWWPLGRSAGIRIAPEWGFGRPVIARRGIRTDILQERREAGDSIADIAGDYGLTPAEVETALHFEECYMKGVANTSLF